MAVAGAVLLLFVGVALVAAKAGGSGGAVPVAPPVAADVVQVAPEAAGPLAGVPIPEVIAAATATATPEAVAEVQPETPQFPSPSESAQLVRLVVPKARVNHRIQTKGLTPKREMEDPGGKDDVAWYNFSTPPGCGSNAVFSGHVDWYTGDRGVFWFLRDVREGDEAEVHYSDGTVLRYRVARVEVYGTNDAPVAEITGPTTKDVLTLITCDGVFQKSTHDYNQRRVVFAERIG